MPDPRFFEDLGPVQAAELARLAGAEAPSGDAAARPIRGVAPLERASAATVSFFADRRYLDDLAGTAAGACFIAPAFADRLPPTCVPLLTGEPQAAYARAAGRLHRPRRAAGAAALDPDADLEEGRRPLSGRRRRPGRADRAGKRDRRKFRGRPRRLHRPRLPNRRQCEHRLRPDRRRRAHPVGRRDRRGGIRRRRWPRRNPGRAAARPRHRPGSRDHRRLHLRRPRGVGRHGDRGGTRIDNLVQIAHNVRLGRNCLLAAHVGLSGSVHRGGRGHVRRPARASPTMSPSAQGR